MSTLERSQEVIVLNKSPIEASDLPLSLKSEIISSLLFPCHPQNVFYLELGASWISVN